MWYHTIELAPGIVTPGWFDTRAVAPTLPIPASLAGLRCLDIGTFDGFWAFEMERRGASEVVAVDLADLRDCDWPDNSTAEVIAEIAGGPPQGTGFRIAADALGSNVKRHTSSIYDVGPDDLGYFDFVYIGSLLLHLRDPVRALAAARSVCRGRLLLVDAVDLGLTVLHPRRPVAGLDGNGRPWWWKANQAGLVRMLVSAGWVLDAKPLRFSMPPGPGHPPARPSVKVLRHAAGREALLRTYKGDPHCALLARPA
jgi:tRNA (mo5U34)-methyltransferase